MSSSASTPASTPTPRRSSTPPTGGVLDEITVEATPEGYAELVELANNHATLRAWAIEGTGGHGAVPNRHLLETSEIGRRVGPPEASRAPAVGAKSDPLDSIRTRHALKRWLDPGWELPDGGERQALSVLLAARRSTIDASTEAQLQGLSAW